MKKIDWIFPVENYKYSVPQDHHPGSFLKERKFHIHEGVDLYGDVGAKVFAVEEAQVVEIFDFTGEKAGSPWWHDTEAILLLGENGYFLYGEIKVRDTLRKGDVVEKGSVIGEIVPLLKKRKGNPTSMLHFEWYDKAMNDPMNFIRTKRDRSKEEMLYKDPKGNNLLNPQEILSKFTDYKTKGASSLEEVYNIILERNSLLSENITLKDNIIFCNYNNQLIKIGENSSADLDLIISFMKDKVGLTSARGSEVYSKELLVCKLISRVLEFY